MKPASTTLSRMPLNVLRGVRTVPPTRLVNFTRPDVAAVIFFSRGKTPFPLADDRAGTNEP